MQSANRQFYAKHPQGKDVAGQADVENFAKNAVAQGWTPTVVNPVEGGNCLKTTGLFWLHILGWVIALLFSALVNFRVSHYMTNATNASGWVDTSNPYGEGATSTTEWIGILGGISTIVGVLVLVGAAAGIKKDEYKTMPKLNLLIQVLTSYGLVASFYIFCHASTNFEGEEWWLSLFGIVAGTWAQMTLYATSVMINVELMQKAFLPSIALSVQFITALAISGDEFKCAPTGSAYANCNDEQKFLGFLVPILTVLGLFFQYGAEEAWNADNLKEKPFMRSLVLLVYFVGAIVSIYLVAMVAAGWDSIAIMFALVGMLFNFQIVDRIFTVKKDA